MIRDSANRILGRYAPYVRGALSYTPLERVLKKRTGGTDNARYCYGVFHRHLEQALDAGLDTIPRVVAELGPGDSLGVGLAWLLAGSERYLGLDVRRYATNSHNLRVFDELVELFRSRADPPSDEEFPELKPHRGSAPATALFERVSPNLEPSRLHKLRGAIENLTTEPDNRHVSYVAPWTDPTLVAPNSIDLIYSQAVLEHVVDLEGVADACLAWLRSGGWMSHQIDLRSHGHALTWDGHRAYSDRQWKLIVGRRPYLINRRPDVDHLDALETRGFRLTNVIRFYSQPTLECDAYAPRFRGLSEESKRTSGLFLQAVC